MSSNVKDVIYSVYRIRMSDYRIISADENFEKLTGYTEKDYREKQLKHTRSEEHTSELQSPQ